MEFKKNLIIITGATGVGKTETSQSIAYKLDGEIINIDIGQFYKPLSIGTAKPDLTEVKTPHHLFDIICDPLNLSVAQYNNIVRAKIVELWSNKKTPILVGGSGFYIYSLLFPPKEDVPTSGLLPVGSWQELNELDPERAKKIHPNDTYRISRAIEINKSGRKASELAQDKIDIFFDNLYLFILERERPELYARINARTDTMLSEGWIDEVRNLDASWREFLKIKKIIGYDDIVRYLDREIGPEAPEAPSILDALATSIKKKTRNYAKRQITFFKYLEKNIVERWPINSAAQCTIFRKDIAQNRSGDALDDNLSLCINELLDKIK